VSPDGSSAQVVIYRERAWTAAAYNWTVWLDGRQAGTLALGGSLTLEALPGLHEIAISFPSLPMLPRKSEPFRFNAQPGDRIDLLAQVSALTGKPRIGPRGGPPGQLRLPDRLRQASAAQFPVPSGPPAPAPAAPVTSTVLEGSRFQVPLGDDTRTIDNSKSSSATVRVVRLTREWARTCSVDVERNMTVRGSAGLGIRVLDLKAEAERALNRTYSSTSEERETFAEEVTLNVAAHMKSQITFFWKEIRQKGVVQISGAGFEAQVPYEVVVGLTFDQQQVDTP
jgi:hypothetical protein